MSGTASKAIIDSAKQDGPVGIALLVISILIPPLGVWR